jgi:type IV pilus assembly protein PilC
MTSAAKLPTFTWTGTNQRGETVRGELNARSTTLLKAELRRQGIMPRRIRKKRAPLSSLMKKKITQKDITGFSRQLATMLSSGIPLIKSFDIITRGLEKASMQELLIKIKTDIESGTTLANALRNFPLHFNALFCNLVDAGEQSGSLEIMLENIATYKEKTESLKSKIKKALVYPCAVIIVAIAVTSCMLIFVVPQFASLFNGFGAELPMLTRIIIDVSAIVQATWWIIASILIAVVYFTHRARQRSRQVATKLDTWLLKTPIVGKIVRKACLARFSRTLAITFAAGLPLVDALKSVAGATGNIVYENATLAIRDNVATGQQLRISMRDTSVFPNLLIQMVGIGEESGSLEDMLMKVASFYEEDVDNAVDNLSSLLEPLIMTFLGVIVGGLVIGMYLPIFKIGSVI